MAGTRRCGQARTWATFSPIGPDCGRSRTSPHGSTREDAPGTTISRRGDPVSTPGLTAARRVFGGPERVGALAFGTTVRLPSWWMCARNRFNFIQHRQGVDPERRVPRRRGSRKSRPTSTELAATRARPEPTGGARGCRGRDRRIGRPGRHPGRRRPRELVHAAARQPVLRPAVRICTVPAKPRWLLAIPDAISQLEALDRQLLTRRDAERLFGVSKTRAAALMQTSGAEPTGNQRTLPRTKLLQQLRRHRAWAASGEEERRVPAGGRVLESPAHRGQ